MIGSSERQYKRGAANPNLNSDHGRRELSGTGGAEGAVSKERACTSNRLRGRFVQKHVLGELGVLGTDGPSRDRNVGVHSKPGKQP